MKKKYYVIFYKNFIFIRRYFYTILVLVIDTFFQITMVSKIIKILSYTEVL